MTGIRFGLGISTSAAAGSDPIADARQAEQCGFDFVSASDHPCGNAPTYEVWTMLTSIAASTSSIGIATRVLGLPYRSPAMVAKMAETLDRLSGGRLILGLGGGSVDDEFRAFGLGVPSARDKVDGLAEAITIIRGLWTQPEFSFVGRLYHTDAADLEPKPQRRIPIWLGTFGPRALAVTGRLADGWIPSYGYVSVEQLKQMRGQVRQAAAESGRDPDDITCACNLVVRIGEAAEGDVVSGSVASVTDQLRELIGLGFSVLNLIPQGPNTADQVEQLATDVVAELRR